MAKKKVAKKAKKVAKPTPTKKKVKSISATTVIKKKTIKPHKLTAFDKKQYKRLLDLRDELIDATSALTKDTLQGNNGASDVSSGGQHIGDAGSDAYDRDLALSILSKEQDALLEIEAAIQRLEEGVYGYCQLSGEKIRRERLEAIPFCRLTVKMQTLWEKKHGKLRFRLPGEPGYTGATL